MTTTETFAQTTEFSVERLQQLEDFFENAPVGLQITAADGAIERANLATLDLLGYLGDPDAYGRSLFMDHFVDGTIGRQLIETVATGEVLNNVNVRIISKDRLQHDLLVDVSARIENAKVVSVRWFLRPRLARSLPRHDELSRAPDSVASVGADGIWGARLIRSGSATKHYDGGNAIQRREFEELNDFFENAPAGVHFVGFNGLILRANRAELTLLGYQAIPEDYVGQHVRKIHSDKKVVEELLLRLVQGRPVINFRARLLRKDGALQPVVIYSGLRLKDGRFENTRCFLFEIPTLPLNP